DRVSGTAVIPGPAGLSARRSGTHARHAGRREVHGRPAGDAPCSLERSEDELRAVSGARARNGPTPARDAPPGRAVPCSRDARPEGFEPRWEEHTSELQ